MPHPLTFFLTLFLSFFVNDHNLHYPQPTMKSREEQRSKDDAKAKEMEEMWMCDPRMLPGWTVHFSKKHEKVVVVMYDVTMVVDCGVTMVVDCDVTMVIVM